jgi:sulfate adenylyltransferase
MITLEDRILCDLEMILLGGFAPLNGFLNEADYNSVVENCRLCQGTVWPLPIVLPVGVKEHDKLQNEAIITLKDKTGLPIARLFVESRWKPDLVRECELAYGSSDTNHPYVDIVLGPGMKDCWYYGGRVEKIMDVKHYDFMEYRMSAEKCRAMIAGFRESEGVSSFVGFQTRNPMHRSHFELTKYALKKCEEGCGEAKLILMPVVGITQSCDVDYQVRTRCYKKLMPYYEGKAELVLIPLSMRMAGPREAVLHAIIRKNYGCTHFIVGRDHAGPSYKKKDGTDFYGPYDAHGLVEKYKADIGIEIVLSQMIVYVENLGKYLPMDEVRGGAGGGAGGDKVMNISGTEQRRLLKTGAEIPEWFSFPEIVEELRLEYRMLNKRGLCIYLTGLSGSGKSTVANFLMEKIMENEKERKITLLDADVVRTNLSKGLGFSREDRSTNVRRIGYVCSEIVKHGGIAIVANIAPYEDDRKYNRGIIEAASGTYVECFVDTTLEKCEERDVKGLYALARKGVIKEFTGISDPYERPINPEIAIDGAMNLDAIIENIIDWLNKRELL